MMTVNSADAIVVQEKERTAEITVRCISIEKHRPTTLPGTDSGKWSLGRQFSSANVGFCTSMFVPSSILHLDLHLHSPLLFRQLRGDLRRGSWEMRARRPAKANHAEAAKVP